VKGFFYIRNIFLVQKNKIKIFFDLNFLLKQSAKLECSLKGCDKIVAMNLPAASCGVSFGFS